MNQPELGNYIAQLRKEQGLTQEELVEKCNINVRTIQRIENGDVTPRSYTIKNILEALGKSFDEVYQGNKETQTVNETLQESTAYNYNYRTLILAGIAGVILFICNQLMTTNDVMHSFTTDNILSQTAYSTLGIIGMISAVILYLGVYHVGQIRANSLLKLSAILAMALNICATVFLVFYIDFNTDFTSSVEIALGIAVVVMTGIAYIMLGAGYLAQRKQEQGIDRYMGFIALLSGGMILTIILAPIALLFIILFDIIQIIYLIKNADKCKKTQLAN